MYIYLFAILSFLCCLSNKNLQNSPGDNLGVDFLLERPLPDFPSLGGNRMLVVLQNNAQKDTHSKFLKLLDNMGMETTIVPYTSAPPLQRRGVWMFDQLVWLADSPQKLPSKSPSGDTFINSQGIFDFVNSGHNLFIASSSNSNKKLSFILRPFGIRSLGPITDLSAKSPKVLNFDLSKIASSDSFFPNKVFYPANYFDTSKPPSGVFSYSGSGHISSPEYDFDLGLTELDASPSALAARNPNRRKHRLQYTIPLLSATATTISEGVSYTTTSRGKEIPPLKVHGKAINLVTAIQRLNQARVLVVGSLNSLSDDSFSKYDNSHIIQNWLSWTFHQKGILRLKHITHKRIEAVADNPNYFNLHNISSDTLYTIKDIVTYEVKLVEWSHSEKTWIPYTSAVPGSLQMEYTMLHPYYRLPLQKTDTPGSYSVTFRVPDVYGIFKFSLFYQAPGYSNIVSEVLAPVRPFEHNQYSRFIAQAYPYYYSIFTLMIGFALLALLLLFGGETPKASSSVSNNLNKKTQ